MSQPTEHPSWDGHFEGLPVASAPISWGACEVPGWGAMPDRETVLSQMAQLHLRGTELGAPGFLPSAPAALRATLDSHGLRFVGSFTPLVLHETDLAPALAAADAVIELLRAAGGEVLIAAAVQDTGWSAPRPLDDAARRRLGDHSAAIAQRCARHGLRFALHPHVGTLLEQADDVTRALVDTEPEVGWCLDTGHLLIGGLDPVTFARDHGDRVAHVHLKDVDADLAAAVREGDVSLLEATRRGLFTPLGQGAAQVGAVLQALRAHGYDGWLVLEQDTAVDADEPASDRAMLDAARSIRFLQAAQRGEEITS